MKIICLVPIARVFVRKIFCMLSKYPWRSLFLVKLHSFSIFVCTTLDWCVWSTKLFFEMHLIVDIQKIFSYLSETTKRLIVRAFDENNEIHKSYLRNKKHKVMFVVVSWSDMHFGFAHPFLRVQVGAPKKLGM